MTATLFYPSEVNLSMPFATCNGWQIRAQTMIGATCTLLHRTEEILQEVKTEYPGCSYRLFIKALRSKVKHEAVVCLT